MSLISGNIKEILSIKLKQRHDSITDQFNRILMVKLLVIFSIVTSMEFFSDKVSCMYTLDGYMPDEFVHSACWIRGFYIYDEVRNKTDECSYYGIPRDVQIDGINHHGHLCRRINKMTGMINPSCKPLTKMYFVHYQYFPFYIASLAIFFYAPYILFRIINSDMIHLKTAVKSAENEQDTKNIIDMYFDYKSNGGVIILRFKVLATVGIKFLYIFISLSCFLFTDHLLNYKYIAYGLSWLRWTPLNNTFVYGRSTMWRIPKPGDQLLPSMGFCDITEGIYSRTKVSSNDHKIVCEISTHIIYQYVLFVLWFLFIISITLSASGLLHYTWRSIYAAIFGQLCKSYSRKQPYLFNFTVREIEYMEFIRVKHLALYKDIVLRYNSKYKVRPEQIPDDRYQ